MLAALTQGPALAEQLERLTALTADLAATLRAIDTTSAGATADPGRVPIEVNLASDGRVTWNDGRQLLVVRALLGAASAARWALVVGTDTSRRVRSGPGTVELVTARAPLLIPRGVDVTVQQVGGGVVAWDLYLWCVPQETDGTTGRRQ